MWCNGIRTSILKVEIRWNVLKSLIDLLSHYWKHETSTSQIFLSNSPKITEPLLLLLMFYFTYIMENGADIKRSLLKYTNCSTVHLLGSSVGWSGECSLHVSCEVSLVRQRSSSWESLWPGPAAALQLHPTPIYYSNEVQWQQK